jgi:hypothetical protein
MSNYSQRKTLVNLVADAIVTRLLDKRDDDASDLWATVPVERRTEVLSVVTEILDTMGAKYTTNGYTL